MLTIDLLKKNELKRKKGLEIKKGTNNYGMKVVKI